MIERYIWVKFTFTALHFYEKASGKTYYLKKPHRHQFHVKAYKTVSHNNRDIEFIQLKEAMVSYARSVYEQAEPTNKSCEDMAEDFMSMFSLSMVTVSEDDENGATLYLTKD